MDQTENFDLHQALKQIDYLNLIILSAAAAPERLPYLQANREIDIRAFQHQIGTLVCLLQAHLADLSAALRNEDDAHGCFADFRQLVADTVERIQGGAPVEATLHRHLRNIFAFESLVAADQPCAYGVYIRDQGCEFELAVGWLLETLSCLECGFTLHEILGEAQNTDVCTRLCFGDAVSALETWRRDLQLILPGSVSVM